MLPTSDHDFSVVRASTGCRLKRTNGTARIAPTAALPAASRPIRNERRSGDLVSLSFAHLESLSLIISKDGRENIASSTPIAAALERSPEHRARSFQSQLSEMCRNSVCGPKYKIM